MTRFRCCSIDVVHALILSTLASAAPRLDNFHRCRNRVRAVHFNGPVRHSGAQKARGKRNIVGKTITMSTILLIILILLLVGALPTWPYSSGWGYYPSGGLGLVVVVLIVLLFLGRI